MQRELIMFVALILGNLHGYSGIPAITQDHSITNDKSATDDDLMMEPDEHSGGDSATEATVRRSTSISASHHPYNQHVYIAATRRDESEHLVGEVKAAAASESFYPSYLRNSRYLQPAEVDRFRPITTTGRAKFAEPSILGSGDFGVLKGGTFYQDSDPPIRSYYNDFYGLNLKSHNGHQRPFASPLVQKYRYPTDPSDPFSNFRDFADINVSNDAGQYSEFYVVYANKNSSLPESDDKKEKSTVSKKPIRNIKDQLDLIDKEISSEQKLSKLSKAKIKLAKTKKRGMKKSKSLTPTEVSSTTLTPDSDSDFMLALS